MPAAQIDLDVLITGSGPVGLGDARGSTVLYIPTEKILVTG